MSSVAAAGRASRPTRRSSTTSERSRRSSSRHPITHRRRSESISMTSTPLLSLVAGRPQRQGLRCGQLPPLLTVASGRTDSQGAAVAVLLPQHAKGACCMEPGPIGGSAPMFGLVLRQLRGPPGLSLRELGKRALYDYPRLSRAENGEALIPAEKVRLLDEVLQAGGLLIALRAAAGTATPRPAAPPSDVAMLRLFAGAPAIPPQIFGLAARPAASGQRHRLPIAPGTAPAPSPAPIVARATGCEDGETVHRRQLLASLAVAAAA